MTHHLFLSQKPTVDELARFLTVHECVSLFALSTRFAVHLKQNEFVARALEYEPSLAARHGHLGAIVWMHTNQIGRFTTCVMDMAATNDHLDVLQWLHENRREGCTGIAMSWATQRGHIDVVKWLYENEKGDIGLAMDWAVAHGHLELAKWLHSIGIDYCSNLGIEQAVRHGQLNVLGWLFTVACSETKERIVSRLDMYNSEFRRNTHQRKKIMALLRTLH